MTGTTAKPGGIMRWITCGVAILAGVMGLAPLAEAGNRGLSPIIHGATNGHETHFHIDLRRPERVGLTNNLLASNSTPEPSTWSGNDMATQAQSLLDQVKADLNLTKGEVTMFIPDMPDVPPQNMPIMIAQANQAQVGDKVAMRTLGVCFPAPSSPEHFSLENVFDPKMSAGYYLIKYEHKSIAYDAPATISVLQQPAHGILRLETEANHFGTGRFDPASPGYAYLPSDHFLGNDKATLLVDFGNGLKVKVVYYFQAIEGLLGNTGLEELCSETGYRWKISSTLDVNGTNTITSVEYQSPTTSATGTTVADTAALASNLGTTLLSNLAGEATGVAVNLADLPGAAVGQTTGSTITLDTNASGYE